jgi:hypothetical protein
MKKLVLTAAILTGFAMSTYAHNSYSESNPTTGGGLFNRGNVSENYMRGDDIGLWFPTHNTPGNWDAEDEPEVPLGEGALLLIGFGAAYAMTRRKKED